MYLLKSRSDSFHNGKTNEIYDMMLPEVEKVRTCIAGEFFVKHAGLRLLPHPSAIDTVGAEQQGRYKTYKANAEFDEFTDNTEKVMIGKMKIDNTDIVLPTKLDYLIDDVDKDCLPMTGLLELFARNCLEVKWHIGLADYKGVSNSDEAMSKDDIEKAKPRATIKNYARENVLDWSFARVNGRMQLTWLLLLEVSERSDPDNNDVEMVYSYLELGLDKQGYYQKKTVCTESGETLMEGEMSYVTVGDKALDFIPVEIVSDEIVQPGIMPMKLGFLNSLADLALARYNVSADYKEALKGLQPMVNIYNVSEQNWKSFKNINERDYVAVGASMPNVWPGESKAEIMESNASLQPFMEYFDKNTQTVRALGGVFKTDIATQRTATEVINEAENQVAVLGPMVDRIEASAEKLIAYCGMFEGIYSVEDPIGDAVKSGDVSVEMPREFAASKLTAEEVKEYREQYLSGLLPKEEFYKVMEAGGWAMSTADDLIAMGDEEGFDLTTDNESV